MRSLSKVVRSQIKLIPTPSWLVYFVLKAQPFFINFAITLTSYLSPHLSSFKGKKAAQIAAYTIDCKRGAEYLIRGASFISLLLWLSNMLLILIFSSCPMSFIPSVRPLCWACSYDECHLRQVSQISPLSWVLSDTLLVWKAVVANVLFICFLCARLVNSIKKDILGCKSGLVIWVG
jgi:hypothetical protein